MLQVTKALPIAERRMRADEAQQMRKKVGRYEKNLAAKVLVLEGVFATRHTTIGGLAAHVNAIEEQAPGDFRYASWARGSVTNIVLFLARCDLLSVSFPESYPRTRMAWKLVRVFPNEYTSRFLKKARREACLALELLVPEVRTAAYPPQQRRD